MGRTKNNATPKKRYTFFGEKDRAYQESRVREFFGEIQNFTVILHRVDMVKSKVHKLYGEAKAETKKLLEPVELTIVPSMDKSETTFIAGDGLFNERIKNFGFAVFTQELEDKDVVINKGDFVAYNDGDLIRYFEISKAPNIKSNNTIAGTKPYYIECKCTHVLEDVIPRMD